MKTLTNNIVSFEQPGPDLLELITIQKGGKNDNGTITSHESVLIHLKQADLSSNRNNLWLFGPCNDFYPIALRKAKTAYNFGLSECNRINYLAFQKVQFIDC